MITVNRRRLALLPDRIAQALAAASRRRHEKADLMVKIAGILSQNPDA